MVHKKRLVICTVDGRSFKINGTDEELATTEQLLDDSMGKDKVIKFTNQGFKIYAKYIVSCEMEDIERVSAIDKLQAASQELKKLMATITCSGANKHNERIQSILSQLESINKIIEKA